MDDGSAAEVDLVGAIEQVRSQLTRAAELARAAHGEPAVQTGHPPAVAFRVGPVELEFAVSYEKAVGADAGVRVWVVSAGAKGEVRHTTGHRVKVTLFPVDGGPDGPHDLLIDDVDVARDAVPTQPSPADTPPDVDEDTDLHRG